MRRISRSIPDLIQWVDPEEWFGIIQPIGGDLYDVLYPSRREADAANLEIGGTIVLVTTSIGADSDEEYVSPDESRRYQDGCRCSTAALPVPALQRKPKR